MTRIYIGGRRNHDKFNYRRPCALCLKRFTTPKAAKVTCDSCTLIMQRHRDRKQDPEVQEAQMDGDKEKW